MRPLGLYKGHTCCAICGAYDMPACWGGERTGCRLSRVAQSRAHVTHLSCAHTHTHTHTHQIERGGATIDAMISIPASLSTQCKPDASMVASRIDIAVFPSGVSVWPSSSSPSLLDHTPDDPLYGKRIAHMKPGYKRTYLRERSRRGKARARATLVLVRVHVRVLKSSRYACRQPPPYKEQEHARKNAR